MLPKDVTFLTYLTPEIDLQIEREGREAAANPNFANMPFRLPEGRFVIRAQHLKRVVAGLRSGLPVEAAIAYLMTFGGHESLVVSPEDSEIIANKKQFYRNFMGVMSNWTCPPEFCPDDPELNHYFSMPSDQFAAELREKLLSGEKK